MKRNEQKAWELLTDKERNSLFLTLTKGSSTWEAGEIMGIAHYKYLELKERAEKFFRLFCDYFETTESLIRPDSFLDSRFKDFIEAIIEKRLSKKEAIEKSGDSALCIPEISRNLIIKSMELLKESKDERDIKLYQLIMEFDRWNSQRILPRVLQQPSAYKRRNTRRDKIYMQYVCKKLDQEQVKNLMNMFWYHGKKKCYYAAIFNESLFDDGYIVMPITRSDKTLERLSNLYIYIFDTEELADVYGYMVTKFVYKTKDQRIGQQFWPEYREHIQRAINYKEVNNLHFYKERLDMAYINNDSQRIRKEKNKLKSTNNIKRVDEKIFYN